MLPNLLEFDISWIFCPPNAHNNNFQSFPEKKYSCTGRLSLCIVRESNPCQQLGRLLCYHYTNDAEKANDRRDQFQNYQTWIFPYTFSECHIKKNQNNSLRSGINFSLTRTICSHSSKAVVVSGLLLLKVNWISKNDKNLQFHEYFVTLTHTIVMLNLSLKLNIRLPPVWVLNFSLKLNILLPRVWVYASYGNRTHFNSLEGCYATTTPTMLKRFTIEEMNFRTFKHGFFLTHFLSVTARKNQRNSLRSGVKFSLTRPICSHSSKAVVVSGLLVLKVNGNLKNDKNLLFHDIFYLWRTQ